VAALKPQVEIINSGNNVAKPGQILNTLITIRNVGSSTAKNIFVGTSDDRTVTTTGVIVQQSIKNIGANYAFVESLGPNETKEIPFTLGVDSTADQITHLVPIIIRFQDENRAEFQVTRSIGVKVEGSVILDASLTPDTSDIPIAGNKVKPSIDLFNTGSGTAHGIVVEVTDNPFWTIESEKKVFIGALDPDGFDSFTIKATLNKSVQPGSYPVTLRFTYADPNYQSQTIEKTVSFQVLSPEQAAAASGQGFPWGTIILVIIILVIGYFGYRRFFAKKNTNKR
jgi:hypothetical protein